MDIDRSAPIQALAWADVVADPEEVWAVIADLATWPEWNPDVRSIVVFGPVAAGTTFAWEAGGSLISSQLHTVEFPRQIGWTGKTKGIDAVHSWRVESHGGSARVTTEESWSGLLPRLMQSRLTTVLQRSLEKTLGYLEAEMDRRERERVYLAAMKAAELEAPVTIAPQIPEAEEPLAA